MTNVVNKIDIVGRIECSRSNTSQSLYVTIVATNPSRPEVRLLTAQSTEQSWCLVRTTTMQDCFIICSYPTMDRVLVATNDPVVGYVEANHIRVEKLQTPIREGEPLPIDPNNKIEFYMFRMEPENCGGYYLCSQSNIFPNTVMQGGFQTTDVSKNPPNVNDFVTLHNRQGLMREWFWFEKVPTRR